MRTTTNISQPMQFTVTLKPGARGADIRKAVRMFDGVETVSMVRTAVKPQRKEKKNYNVITPELEAVIDQAMEEYARGETIHFDSIEEMHRYFENSVDEDEDEV